MSADDPIRDAQERREFADSEREASEVWYSVGWSVPGFLPETDPVVALGEDEAERSLREDLRGALDALDDDPEDDAEFLAADTVLNVTSAEEIREALRVHGSYSFPVRIRNRVHWVERISSADAAELRAIWGDQ